MVGVHATVPALQTLLLQPPQIVVADCAPGWTHVGVGLCVCVCVCLGLHMLHVNSLRPWQHSLNNKDTLNNIVVSQKQAKYAHLH